ncbi:MAG: hypothetical protein LJE89_12285 [Deltaproteobacteria bacterium]|nr:hypothetical protein [Deltaproteobacteria bacterium]
MLNTYRVISLSLVTALFFAAPLLCVHPISSQIKKAERRQQNRLKVVSQRAIYNPQIKVRSVSAAWARSIHRTGHQNFPGEDPLATLSREDGLYEDYRGDWDAAGEDGTIVNNDTVSHSDL